MKYLELAFDLALVCLALWVLIPVVNDLCTLIAEVMR